MRIYISAFALIFSLSLSAQEIVDTATKVKTELGVIRGVNEGDVDSLS